MSLARATVPLAGAPFLPPGPPFAARDLDAWDGVEFDLPPGDLRLRALYRGGREPVDVLANLVGYAEGWAEYPDYIDTLDPDSPVHEKKMLERALTLHHWGALRGLPTEAAGRRTVLDIGCGVGRFATWFLDRGDDVCLIDGDLRSLRHAVWHGAGRKGRLDAYWTTAEALPAVAEGFEAGFDVAVLAEILNYVERPTEVLSAVASRLKPDGHVLFSLEARYGWALSTDVIPRLGDGFFSGVAFRGGDRHVVCYDEAGVRTLFEGWDVEFVPSHWVLSGPFELLVGADVAHGAGKDEGRSALPQLLDWEQRFAADPVSAPLHRAWVGVARPKRR